MASPADPDTGSWKAGDVASKIKLASNVHACWVPSVRVVSEAVAALCSNVSLAEELDGVLTDKKGKHPPLNLTGPATAALTPGGCPRIAPVARTTENWGYKFGFVR